MINVVFIFERGKSLDLWIQSIIAKNLEEKIYMTKDEGVWDLAGEKVKLKEITRIMRVWSQMCTDNLACLDWLVFPQMMDLSLLT